MLKFLKYFEFSKYKNIEQLKEYVDNMLGLDPHHYVPMKEYTNFQDI